MRVIQKERVSTGVTGLDEMLRGGLLPGRPYLVSGVSGSGKTTFAIQFLQAGVKKGERALLVSIDEPPAEIRENVKSFGWDVGKIRILDAHPGAKAYSKRVSLVEVAAQSAVGSLREARYDAGVEALKKVSPDISVQSLQLMLKREMREMHYSRLAIDSLTSLKRLADRSEDLRRSMMSLLRFISETHATSLVIAETPSPEDLEPETFISRGEIRLHKRTISSRIERFLTVEKFRGSAHDTMPRPMVITDKGLSVNPHKRVGKDALRVLQALPTYYG